MTYPPATGTGGDLLAQVLKESKISHVFTLTGGHIAPILIGCDEVGIRVIDVRAEANAAFAADAYSRLSGKVGVAVVTAGPGVTNSITALKNAQLAESPLLLIGGTTATMLEGRGSLQDIDQLTLLKSTTKWLTSVRRVQDLVPKIKHAIKIAREGVPGPVFVEVPVDILYPEEIVREWYGAKNNPGKSLMGKITYWYINRHVNRLFANLDRKFDFTIEHNISSSNFSSILTKILPILENSKKPMILASSQIVSQLDLIPDVVKALEKLNIPVYLSGMARGLLGGNSSIQYKHQRSQIMKEADVIVLLGTPLDFRLDYGRKLGRKAHVISVNLSTTTLRMNRSIRKVDTMIQGNPQEFIIQLIQKFTPDSTRYDNWHERIRSANEERKNEIMKMMDQEVYPSGYVNPLKLAYIINSKLDKNAVLVADGGDFVASFSYVTNPQGPLQWLDPGPFGTLGVGAGFALGSKCVNPGNTIWLIYGDGALGFSLIEFDTFTRHNLPVIAIVGNDASWQQIAREQVEIFDTDLSTKLDYSDYHVAVEGLGAKGVHIGSNEEIEEKLDLAIKYHSEGHSVLVNVKIGSTNFRKGSISM